MMEPWQRPLPEDWGSPLGKIAALPSGVVTLLFSDIERSTLLLKTLGNTYDAILEAHHELMRAAFAAHGGIELSTEGDSFFVVFASASDAIAGALAAQLAIGSHPWPRNGVVRVRIGLHTGPVRRAGENYIGMTVHEAARIAASAHGGQIVASETTVDASELPSAASLRSLGPHRLKDIDDDVRLFQVCSPDLPGRFPALRSARPPAGSLRTFASSFIGRSADRAALSALARERRLVTVVGPPGVGKTRLAIEVAGEVGADRRAGARLVELDTIGPPRHVADEVARALDIPERPEVSSSAAVAAHLAATDAVIVFDNCEHVADEVATLAQLLIERCPLVHLLLTSREPINIDGETILTLSPLPEAAELFAERAASARPGLVVYPDDPDVLAICDRVDGLPLAVEIAAAQTRRLSVAQIASHLASRYTILGTTVRRGRERHATLRAAIDWSYDLLDSDDALRLRRLAVFAGSFDAEAAAVVAGIDDTDDVLGRLADRSLITIENGKASRYRLLATIRAYLASRLVGPDRDDAEAAHARHYRDVGRRAATAPNELTTLALVDPDLANHHLALAWHRAHDPRAGLAYAVDLDAYWAIRAAPREGTATIEAFLAAASDVHASLRATASAILADLHRRQGRFDDARRCAEEAMAIDVRAGCDRGQVSARLVLGQILAMQGEVPAATKLFEANLGDAIARGDIGESVMSQRLLASLAIDRGDAQTAHAVLRSAVERTAGMGDTWMMGPLLSDRANLALLEGRLDEARRLMRETLAFARRFGEMNAVAECLLGLARIARHEGALDEALVLVSEAGKIYEHQDDLGGIAHVLTERAVLASHMGDHCRAVTLLGGQAALRTRLGLAVPGREVSDIESATEQAGAALGADAVARFWHEGEQSSVEALLASADADP